MLALLLYHALLLAGLSAMLLDSGGGVAFVAYSLGMPLGALAVWIHQGYSFRALGLAPYHRVRSDIILGFVAAVTIPLALFGLTYGLGWADDVQRNVALSSVIMAVIVPQVFVASMEELAFRGVTQSLLVARFGPTRGVLAAAGLFGLFHLPNVLYQDVPLVLVPITLGTLALMGWVFGIAYQRTGNRLLLPITLHYAWNVASFGISHLLSYHVTGPRMIVGVPAWFPESGLLGTLGLAALGMMLVYGQRRQALKR